MLDQVSDSGVNAFKAVFWHQGENDVNNSVTKNEYKLALEDLTDAIGTNISGNPPIMVAQIGYKTTSSPSREDLDAIRIAQSELWDENSDILAGPSLYDVGPLADGVHFSTNLQIQTLANRWWASIEEAFYSGAKGRGPKFLKAVEDDTRTILYVYFNNIEETLLPSESIEGFRVEDDGVSVTISSVELINEEIVKITLSSALEGVATVSLGSGNDMGNLTDSSEYSLPAEAFVEESVDVDNLAPADPTINNISIGDTSISGTAESGTIITVDDVTCSNSPIIVGYDGLWECQNVSPAISYGTYTAVSTDIGGNESSDTYEIIAPVIAEATPRRTYGTTRLNRNNITVNDKVCNVIKIYQNLKIGARDGLYNNFTKGVVVDVKNLQTYLKSLGFNPGPIDGIFGQMTFNEVKRWQSQLGLLSDGVIGPISRSFIKNNCDNN